jgi:HTH-type transcriptional regulator/antitoxin HipB
MYVQHIVILTAPQLGHQLLAARKAQKLTQGAVAAKVGVAQSRISDLEKRPGEISLEQLLSWCAALGMELSVGQRGASVDTREKADW